MDTHLINVKRLDFTMHLMQHLSTIYVKKTPFSHHLQKSTCKGKLSRRNSKPAYCSILYSVQNTNKCKSNDNTSIKFYINIVTLLRLNNPDSSSDLKQEVTYH